MKLWNKMKYGMNIYPASDVNEHRLQLRGGINEVEFNI